MPIQLPVTEEQPVDLIVNNNHLATFMCTPQYLKQLAVGFLWGRKIITSRSDINVLGACDDMRKIVVRLTHEIDSQILNLEQVLSSGCGSGGYVDEVDLLDQTLRSDFVVSVDFLRRCFQQMYKEAKQYQETGGIHSAALIDKDKVLDVKEDVGRHNAVDKVLGTCLMKEYDPAKCALITTGRLSSDMVLKALGAGIPLIATRSIPTTLALEIAEKTNLTLIGRAQRANPFIYCGGDRIVRRKK